MTRGFRIVVAMALLGLGGCADLPPNGSAEHFLRQQMAAAEAVAETDPAAALAFLRPLATLEPDDGEIAARIAALEEEIEARFARAIERGRTAYERGDRRAGDAAMMRALALAPGRDEALAALRRSVSEVSHDRQAEKVASSFTEREAAEEEQALARLEQVFAEGRYEQVLDLGESGTLEDRGAARDLTLQAHVGLADRARSEGDRDAELRHLGAALALADGENRQLLAREEALRDSLSDEAYRGGLTLMQKDLAGAIAQFERAMFYDPDNLAAKTKLEQARTLKRNLDRIRGT